MPMIDGSMDDAAIRRLAKIDLNLLVVFAALMQDHSVTLAARRLHVGQPAVSASLKRLRTLLDDPLFVKVGRGIVATDRARALQPAVAQALDAIDVLASTPSTFDPAVARVTVRVGLSDDNEIVFLPALFRAMARASPETRLVARSISHVDIRDALDRGEVDVGMSVFGELSPWHSSTLAFEQGYGVLFDPRHAHGSTKLGLHDFLASRQAIVTFDGALEGKVDAVLADRKRVRDVRIGTMRFGALPYLVRGSPLIASLPELVGRVLARTHRLAFSPLPFAVPPGRQRIAWHRRNELDPVNRWLRALLLESVRRVAAEVRTRDRR